MIRKCDSQDSIGLFSGHDGFVRMNSNQMMMLNSTNILLGDAPDSAFRRVQSNEQELKISDVGDTAYWFRQHTKELKMENEEMDIENIAKNKDSLLGKIMSKTFSEFQPLLCREFITYRQ